MSWAKLDDHFPTHPKVIAAGPEAAWLYVCGVCYCAEHLTDGAIPKTVLPMLSTLKSPARLAARLVDVGLWHDQGETFGVHDYLTYNPSREHVENERRAARERRQRVAGTSAERRANVADKVGADVRGYVADPDPTRPDVPSEHERGAPNGSPAPSTNGNRKARGTRVPIPFDLSDDMLAWADRECPKVDWETETEKFVDYWKAKPGKDGVKLDWPATWRNWIRRANEPLVKGPQR